MAAACRAPPGGSTRSARDLRPRAGGRRGQALREREAARRPRRTPHARALDPRDDRLAGGARGGGARLRRRGDAPEGGPPRGRCRHLRALGGGPVGVARLRARRALRLRGGGGHARRPAVRLARRHPPRDRGARQRRGGGARHLSRRAGTPGAARAAPVRAHARRDRRPRRAQPAHQRADARDPLRRPRRRPGRGHARAARRAAGGGAGRMKLEHSFQVAAPLDRVAPCLPGAEITEAGEDGTYHGTFSVRLGPTTAAYRGQLAMEDVDADAHRAVMRASGQDKRGQGSAKATIVSTMREEGGATTVDVETDFTITGRLARFGRGGMIEDVSNRLLRDFSDCLQKMIETSEATPEAAASEPGGGERTTIRAHPAEPGASGPPGQAPPEAGAPPPPPSPPAGPPAAQPLRGVPP